MLSLSDTSISEIVRILSSRGIESAFIVPTATGIDKSILDATDHVKSYFFEKGFHNYETQKQGIKEYKKCHIVTSNDVITTKVSLYRPETKNGDPRIWIYGLKKHVQASNLISLIVHAGELFAVNCSRENLLQILDDPSSPLNQISSQVDVDMEVPNELLAKLREIHKLGYVESMRKGATGVGYTLETLLGIKANSRTAPDFKGIEIKSTRLGAKNRPGASSLNTMFSKIPNWGISPYSAEEALKTFGYRDEEKDRVQLYCSIFGNDHNTLGFRLKPKTDLLAVSNEKANKAGCGKDVFRWLMTEVRTSFSQKHKETFWVGARQQRIGGEEKFRYDLVRHTRKPLLSTFDRLLETGGICVDLTMSERSSGNGVRDHGYLFRVTRDSFDDLLPVVGKYSLSS